MPSSPLISVLLPSYNHGRYIQETILSVLNQTVEDFELLILDDHSTDDSFNIIEAMARQDRRIQAWRNPENIGLIPTLNALMDRATGTYIAQIDSDDAYLPERFFMGLMDMRAHPNLSASFTAHVCMDEHGSVFTEPVLIEPRVLHGHDFMQYMAICNCVCACTGFMRADAIHKIGSFARPYSHVHDWDRWLRLSLVGGLMWRPEVGARYRKHGANQSLQRKVSVSQQISIGLAMSPKAIDHHGLGTPSVARYHAHMAALCLEQNQAQEALKHLIAKSRVQEFYEHESIWFLQCLTLLGHRTSARRFASNLERSRAQLQPLARRQLDEINQALDNMA